MSTLDHLTGGRIGWNIVTGYLDSAARALGYAEQMQHDDRYDLADEYMDAVYALWEGSWDTDAVIRDAGRAIYTDPAKVRRIEHSGRQYRISAAHLCEPSPQRTPVLYQAGSSERGRRFAALHAECVFVNGTNPAAVAALVTDLRARAAPRPLRVFVGATVVVGRTQREAQDLLADYAGHASAEAALAHASASLGIDFARFGMDEPIAAGKATRSSPTLRPWRNWRDQAGLNGTCWRNPCWAAGSRLSWAMRNKWPTRCRPGWRRRAWTASIFRAR